MVEIARALSIKPSLLLLDEPSSGLNPEETEDLSFWLEDINEELGITIIMVEHDMKFIESLGVEIIVLHDGSVLTRGKMSDVKTNKQVIDVYLGR